MEIKAEKKERPQLLVCYKDGGKTGRLELEENKGSKDYLRDSLLTMVPREMESETKERCGLERLP